MADRLQLIEPTGMGNPLFAVLLAAAALAALAYIGLSLAAMFY